MIQLFVLEHNEY